MKFAIQINDKKLNCVYATNAVFADRCINRLLDRSGPCLGFDIETGKAEPYRSDPVAGLCPYRSFPSLVQFYDGIDCVYMFDALTVPLEQLRPVFEAKRLVAHNAIFDAQHMAHAGFPNLKIDCSMIMYHLVRAAEFASPEEEDNYLEEEWEGGEGEGQVLDWLGKGERYGASLRSVVAKLLGIQIEKDHQTSNWTDRPLSQEQLVYAAKDSWLTFEVGRILARKIQRLGLSKIYKLNRQAIHPVVQMILNGMELDETKHRRDCKRWAKEKDALEVTIARTFGSAANVRSTHQISNWLQKNLPIVAQHQWPRSEKTGKLRSDAKSLSKFDHLPFVTPLLQYKKLDKMLSTYGLTLLDKICPVTSRLHGSFTLGYTATGRLSSRSPNLQNLPRDSDIRGIFRASKGSILVGADYSQIELRVAGELSADRVIRQAYRDGIDLHSYLASVISGKRIDKITKEERSLSKAINFGLLFGLGAKGLIDYARWNYGVALTDEQATSHVQTFFKTYSGYAKWQYQQRDSCKYSGTTTTMTGKVRKLQKKGAYTRSVNHPVQGSAAEIVITALNMLHRYTSQDKTIKLINCVHDEVVMEVKHGYEEEAELTLRTVMEEAAQKIFSKMSMNKLVEVKQGATWADTK